MLVSGEIGAAKPAPAFYSAVEARLRETGTAVALVLGDGYVNDLAPALARGWPVLGVRRDRPVPIDAAGVEWVADLSEVGEAGDGE